MEYSCEAFTGSNRLKNLVTFVRLPNRTGPMGIC